MRIYLASGFFTKETRQKVIDVALLLREQGHSVFVPMEHEIQDGNTIPNKKWGAKVFEMDVTQINSCDMVYYLDFGYQGDCGAAWEVGYAYAKNIPIKCIAYGETISLMIANSTKCDFLPEQK